MARAERGSGGRGAGPARLGWLDGMKGISILWIAFFHFFGTWQNGRYPSALGDDYFAKYLAGCASQGVFESGVCLAKASLAGIAQLGFHAVGVFIVLSGFALAYSVAKTGDPLGGWLAWYRSRVLRLFPMYWMAHLLYLVSPFQARPEPIDYRFWLSFLGDRVVPIDMIPFYFNPALWYFGLLLELYLVFPLLFRGLQRLGVTPFLALAAIGTVATRYFLLCVYPVNGQWVQGSFFMGRLWEFALGMAAGLLWRKRPDDMNRLLFAPATLAAGVALYTAGLYSYGALWAYSLTDALLGTGLSLLLAHLARGLERVPGIGGVIVAVGAYSYGLYLIHQPYVIWFGERMRELTPLSFLAAAALVIAILTLASMAIERGVKGLANRLLKA